MRARVRHPEDHGGPAFGAVPGLGSPPVRLGDGPDDREPEAGPTIRPRADGVGPGEGLERPGDEPGWESLPGVGDLKGHLAVEPYGLHRDGAARGRVSEGVVDEVGHGLTDPEGVEARVEPGGHAGLDADVAG